MKLHLPKWPSKWIVSMESFIYTSWIGIYDTAKCVLISMIPTIYIKWTYFTHVHRRIYGIHATHREHEHDDLYGCCHWNPVKVKMPTMTMTMKKNSSDKQTKLNLCQYFFVLYLNNQKKKKKKKRMYKMWKSIKIFDIFWWMNMADSRILHTTMCDGLRVCAYKYLYAIKWGSALI